MSPKPNKPQPQPQAVYAITNSKDIDHKVISNSQPICTFIDTNKARMFFSVFYPKKHQTTFPLNPSACYNMSNRWLMYHVKGSMNLAHNPLLNRKAYEVYFTSPYS